MVDRAVSKYRAVSARRRSFSVEVNAHRATVEGQLELDDMDTATTEIYTLSLHEALPIWPQSIAEKSKLTIARKSRPGSESLATNAEMPREIGRANV